MNSPLVSIALRAYNQEKQVRKAIESILVQALYFPIEIVCGVDKSQDQTLQVVQEISQTLPSGIEMRVVSHSANKGGGK